MKKKTKGYANGGKLRMSTKMMAGGGKTTVSVKGDDSITPGHSSRAAIRRKKMAAKKKKMASGGQVPKRTARGSGAARTQYFRKNG